MMENKKHGQYITELGTGQSLYKQITAAQVGVSGARDLNGARFSLGYSYLTEPFLMVAEEHTHDFDQAIFVMGGDPGNIGEFGAEIEMSVNKEKHLINYAACIYIPAGVLHCPLDVKKVIRPVMFIDITFSPGFSIRPLPPTSKR
jgi:hypothetical protein